MKTIAEEEPGIEGTWHPGNKARSFARVEHLVEERRKLEGCVEIILGEIVQTTIDFWWVSTSFLAQHMNGVNDFGHNQECV